MRKATVYDVAEKAGVSIATVSSALHHPEKVRPETRERIRKAADSLGYVRNASAVSLAGKRQNALGLFAFDMLIDRPNVSPTAEVLGSGVSSYVFPLYVDEVQRGFQLACWHQHQALIVGSGDSTEEYSVANIAGRVDGLAIFPSVASRRMDITHLSAQRPVVYFSEGRRDEHACFINCDNAQGMKAILNHLVNEHLVKKIVFVGDPASYDVETRYSVTTEYCRHAGIHFGSVFGRGHRPNLRGLKGYCRPSSMPDAFVCATDQTALLVIQYLKSAGYSIPGDVIVTGFDGILAGKLSSPTLTTVRQPMEEMGERAVEVLMSQNGEPFAEKKAISMRTELVVGQSCGCRGD